MITTELCNEAIAYLAEHWGAETAINIVRAGLIEKVEMPVENFFNKYTAYRDEDWRDILLAGIKDLFPTVYSLLPNDMGPFALHCLLYTLPLCGVDILGG